MALINQGLGRSSNDVFPQRLFNMGSCDNVVLRLRSRLCYDFGYISNYINLAAVD